MSSLRLVETTPACQAGMVFTASRSSGLHHPLALQIFSVSGVICSLNRQITPPDLKEHLFGAFVVKGKDDESPPDARFNAEMSWNRMASLPVSSCAGRIHRRRGKDKVMSSADCCDVKFKWDERHHPNRAVIGWPLASVYGRPVRSTISCAGSRPNRQNRVAAKSPGLTASLSG